MSIRDEIDAVHRATAAKAASTQDTMLREFQWVTSNEEFDRLTEALHGLIEQRLTAEMSGIWTALQIIADRLDADRQ